VVEEMEKLMNSCENTNHEWRDDMRMHQFGEFKALNFVHRLKLYAVLERDKVCLSYTFMFYEYVSLRLISSIIMHSAHTSHHFLISCHSLMPTTQTNEFQQQVKNHVSKPTSLPSIN